MSQRLRVLQKGPARVPARRLLLYALLFSGVLGLSLSLGLGVRGTILALLAAAAGLGSCLAFARLQTLAGLPWFVVAVGLALAVGGIGRSAGFPPAALAWVVGALIWRFLLSLHPAFPAVDVFFHAHNLAAYKAGTLITSHVGGLGEGGDASDSLSPASVFWGFSVCGSCRDAWPGRCPGSGCCGLWPRWASACCWPGSSTTGMCLP